MIARFLSAALAAGVLAAVVATGLERTLIAAAEVYGRREAHHAARALPIVPAHAGHDHAAPEGVDAWQPAEGLPRTAFTALATPFAARSITTGVVFWALIGLGWGWQGFGRPSGTADA